MADDEIDVCVCTFRRPSLAATIRSVAAQRGDHPALRLIVADNDEHPSAEELATALCREVALPLLYLHAPSRNISLARNAALAHVTAPLLAFIDDDEIADPHWIAALCATQRETGADIVLGPVDARYGAVAPRWLREADLHSIRPVTAPDGEILNGYTSNVLIRTSILQRAPAPRFDLEFGRSGGEDTLFFEALRRAGARFAFSPDARVTEDVPTHRQSMHYLLRRAFRMGQTHAGVLARRAARPSSLRFHLVQGAIAAAKCAACLLGALPKLASARWRRQLFRATLHAGVVARLCGWRELRLY